MNNILSMKNKMRSVISINRSHSENGGKEILLPTDPILEEDIRRRIPNTTTSIASKQFKFGSNKGFMDVFPKFDSQANLTNYFFGSLNPKLNLTDLSLKRDSEVGFPNTSNILSSGGDAVQKSQVVSKKSAKIPACFLKNFPTKGRIQNSLSYMTATGGSRVAERMARSTKKMKLNHSNISLKNIEDDDFTDWGIRPVRLNTIR